MIRLNATNCIGASQVIDFDICHFFSREMRLDNVFLDKVVLEFLSGQAVLTIGHCENDVLGLDGLDEALQFKIVRVARVRRFEVER